VTESLYNKEFDFEAEITILTENEGGRNIPPSNGIRWDFRYAEDAEDEEYTLFMIWPEFVSDDGLLIPRGVDLCGTYRARMYVVDDAMKEKIHNQRIKEGVKFYMVEGPRIVAKGIVTSGIRN
jgi:translation elongation factor EF-Tu-like GTPase